MNVDHFTGFHHGFSASVCLALVVPSLSIARHRSTFPMDFSALAIFADLPWAVARLGEVEVEKGQQQCFASRNAQLLPKL